MLQLLSVYFRRNYLNYSLTMQFNVNDFNGHNSISIKLFIIRRSFYMEWTHTLNLLISKRIFVGGRKLGLHGHIGVHLRLYIMQDVFDLL